MKSGAGRSQEYVKGGALRRRESAERNLGRLAAYMGHHGKKELIKNCIGTGWHFPTEIRRPRVAHFCGRKPFLFDRQAYSRPITIARLEHHRRERSNLGAWLAVISEERRVLLHKRKAASDVMQGLGSKNDSAP